MGRLDDLDLSLRKGIPVRHVVDLQGRFRPEVTPFAGLFVKKADPKIIEDLTRRGLMYRAETIRHTYPFCWRCGTALIYYALDSWYVRTTERKAELIANNAATNWVPAHIKTGRMGDWLENNVDWAFSRGFHRVIGRLEPRNTASARVLEKLGMRSEAHLVENEWVKGEWQSELIYAILEHEWRSVQ